MPSTIFNIRKRFDEASAMSAKDGRRPPAAPCGPTFQPGASSWEPGRRRGQSKFEET